MNAGDSDGFLLAFDRDLTAIGSRQFGWSGRDTVGQLAVNAEGDVYFAVSSPGTESDSWTGGALLGKFAPPF